MSDGSEQEHFYKFLDDGGETGKLVKDFDWSTSPLGPISSWPQSLCTTLGIILHSAFPMFLFWGDEHISFYNDAFRQSLGSDGKHPSIGKRGAEMWGEIWEFIGPLIQRVMEGGKPVYYENQPVGFFRNGRFEDIYWTFSYSPAYGDNGKIAGVVVVCTETTRYMQLIRQLEESEQRFRTMAEDSAMLVAISDETGNATYFNKAWEAFTGRSQADLLNYGWADLLHPEDRDPFLNVYMDALTNQTSWSMEFRGLNAEGEYRWLLARGPARFTADGTFAGYISSCMDITERKIAEQRLRESEHRIRNIIESAPFPIGVYAGRNMKIEFVNQSILEVWGKGNNVVGKTYFEVLPELESQDIYPQLDKVFVTGIPFHARNQRVDLTVNGVLQPFYFNYSFTPLYDTEGNIYGVMNTAAEVTDLHLAKQKVEQSEKNLRNMVLQAPVAMSILIGPDHIVEVANSLFLSLWGKPETDILNRPFAEALPDLHQQRMSELMKEAYATGKTYTANEKALQISRDGGMRTVYQNFVYEPYRDADGNILGILFISIDVTAQVHARQKIEDIVADRTEALEIANQNLAKSNAELAQFAYIASHDLQEPIRKITTYTQMLERNLDGKLDETARTYLNKINTSSTRMHALIRDVLTYSELDRKTNNLEEVNLNSVIADVITDFELLIEQKEASVHYSDLPIVRANAQQMSQLFGNLISNSLKFSKKGVQPIVQIEATRLNAAERPSALADDCDYHLITVSDNGIGIRKEFSDQIFNIFQRLHRKSEFEGTGIGLAICKKIALNHEGYIDASGSSDHGAVFNIYLPVSKQPELKND